MGLLSRPSSVENSPKCVHSSRAKILKTRACSAIFLKSFNKFSMLCKNVVKSAAIFCCDDLAGFRHGFLFVFPEANLYNAARLAGRVSFKVIFK